MNEREFYARLIALLKEAGVTEVTGPTIGEIYLRRPEHTNISMDSNVLQFMLESGKI